MRHYLITWHETDGNDTTVYDTVVEAPSVDGALSILAFNIERNLNENGQPYSEDGNELGYYFDCTDECGEDCEGHGGIVLRDVEVFDTEDEAIKGCAFYHTRYECERGSLDNTLRVV